MGSPIGSVTLSGSSQYVRVSAHEKLNFPSDLFSVESWFKTSSSATARLVTKLAVDGSGYRLSLVAGQVVAEVATGTTVTSITSAATYADNAWHYAAFSVDRGTGTLLLFVDSTLKTAALHNGSLSSEGIDLILGANQAGTAEFFNGSLGEIRINRFALEPQAIDVLPVCSEGDAPGCELLFDFSEGHGNVLMDVASSAVSATDVPTTSDGTIVGFVSDATNWSVDGPLYIPLTMIGRKAVLYTLDNSVPFRAFCTERNVKIYRGRRNDSTPFRHYWPQVSIIPLATLTSESVRHSYSYQVVTIVIRIIGSVSPEHDGEAALLERMAHLIEKALFLRDAASGSTMGISSITELNIGPAKTLDLGRGEGFEGPTFRMDISMGILKDLRSSAQR